MVQALKKKLKNEKGFTLIELLAVIVILGILAAIAIPSILGIIDNSKKDAHVANAQQMISAAKMAIAGDQDLQSGNYFLTLNYLEKDGFIEKVKDPDGNSDSYLKGTVDTPVKKDTLADDNISYVKIEDGKVTKVKLVNSTRGVQTDKKEAVDPDQLKRTAVNPS